MINIASAKHAITKNKIIELYLPFLLDSTFLCVHLKACLHSSSPPASYIHDGKASVLHITLPRVVVHERCCGTLCPLV